MRALHKSLVYFLCLVPLMFVFVGISTPIVASAAVAIDNDGSARDNPYGDSKIPASFEGVTYTDCYVPYALTLEEIGGLSTQSGHAMPSSYYKYHVGDYVNYEGDMFSWSGNYWRSFSSDGAANIGTCEYESDTGCAIIKDSNGTKYYVMAVQGFFFKGTKGDLKQATGGAVKYQSDNSYLDYKRQIIDVILTDGTVIHFTAGCFNSLEHTNGTIPSLDGQGQDGRYYANGMIPLKMTQYRHLFQAEGGNCIELWGKSGAASKFASKYNLSTSGGGNHIAYYRVYDAKIEDAPKPANEEVKAASYSLGEVNISASSAGNTGISINDIAQKYDETYFLGDFSGLVEHGIALPSSDWLQHSEQQEIANWKSTIELLQEDKKYSVLRACVMFVGILMIVYSTLLFLAFQFDKINNFVDIELVSYLTLGKLVTSRDEISTYNKEEASGKPKAVVQKDIAMASITGITAGVLLLSGKLYAIISLVVSLVSSIF